MSFSTIRLLRDHRNPFLNQIILPAPGSLERNGGFTARISRIDRQGNRKAVIDGLPSSQTSPALGSLVSGVADVAFVGRKLYALLAGAGCSHGLKNTVNGVIRVHRNGTATLVADLSDFVKTHPVKNPEEDDFEPDGTW